MTFMRWIIILILFEYGRVTKAGLIRRFKRDFVPPGSAALNALRPPQPDPLRPEHVDPNNPYLESLSEPFYPSYGLGVGYQRPFILGGAANIPTGNVFRPSESVNGTFGFTQLANLRLGTQGGPFYPWQDPKYAGTAKYMSMLQYQQQQQQAMMAEAATQQAMQRQQASAPNAGGPSDPFGLQNAPAGNGGMSKQALQSMPANNLATPPPLPARFSLL